MKKNQKPFVITFSIIILLLLLFIVFIIFQNNTDLFKINTDAKKEEENRIEDKISYLIYDFPQETAKICVTIQRQNGIDSIKYMQSNEQIELSCNGKQTVSIDMVVELDKEYNFNIFSNDTETIETIKVDANILDDYIIFNDQPLSEESKSKQLEIKYDPIIQQITKYYKLGYNASWVQYTDKLSIDLDNDNIFDLNDIKPGTNILPIYAKGIDSQGKEVLKEYTYEIDTKVIFDIFRHVQLSGRNLSNYGFSVSWNNCEITGFDIRNLRAGHIRQSANFSATFGLNFSFANTRLENTSFSENSKLNVGLHIISGIVAFGFDSWINSSSTIYYDNSTTSYNTIGTQRTENAWRYNPYVVNINQESPIQNISFYIGGLDGNGETQGCIQSLILTDIVLNTSNGDVS